MIETSYNHVLEIALSWFKLTSKLIVSRHLIGVERQPISIDQLTVQRRFDFEPKTDFFGWTDLFFGDIVEKFIFAHKPFFLGRIWNHLMALMLFNKGQTSRTMVNPNSLFILLSSYAQQLTAACNESKQQQAARLLNNYNWFNFTFLVSYIIELFELNKIELINYSNNLK